ncbi:MAG: hypothetical protein ACPL25_12345, partial [Ignavibacteria bacterium]
FNYENIPQELKKYQRFVLFNRDKAPKTIYNTGAKANDPNTWNSFDECYKAWVSNPDKFLGIGIELGELEEGKVLAGIDLDHIIDDNGNITDPSFQILIEKIGSYTEISPSGKGIHILFFLNEIMGSVKNNIEHLEFYSQGRYFTMTGNIYKDFKELKELTTEQLDFILHNTIFMPDIKDGIEESQNINQILIEKGITIEKIVNYYSEKYPEFKTLRKKGTNKYWTKSPFHSSNTGHNFELDYEKNVWYCWRHNLGGSVFELIAFCEGILSCKDYGLDPETVRPRMNKEDKIKIWKDKKEQFKKTVKVVKEKFNIDFTMLKNKNIRNTENDWFDNKGNIIRENIVNSIINKFEHIISSNENIYLWLNDHYDEQGKEIIAKYIHENAPELSSRTISDLVQEIYNLTFITKEELKKMQLPKKFLPVKNGLINLETFEFLTHTPNYFYTKKLNVIYNPNKIPKHFVDYLLSRFENNYTEMFKVIEDFAVAHLRDNRFQIISIWMGLSKTETGLVSGEEGKTFTAENIIGRTYFGDELFTKVDLRVLSEKDNEWYTLKDKWWHTISVNEESHILNFAKTIEDLRDPSFQKPIKHAKHQELIENQAYHILIGNTFPPINANTKAIYRSLKKIVYWKKSMGEDWKYLEKINEDDEKSGMLNLALLFIKIIQARGSLYGTLNIDNVPDEYTRISEPLVPILNSIFEKDPNGQVEQHEAYKLVIEKAQEQENIMQRLSLAKLTKLLRQNFGAVLSRTTTKETINENGENKKITRHQDFYIGIKIKNNENNNKIQIEKMNSDTLEKALLDYLKTIPKNDRIRVSDLSFLFHIYINIENKEKKLGYSDTLFLKSLENLCRTEFSSVSEFLMEVEKASKYKENNENIIKSQNIKTDEIKYFKTAEYYTKEYFSDMGIALIDSFDSGNEHYYRLKIPNDLNGENAYRFSSYFSMKAIPISEEEFESKRQGGAEK